MRSIRQLKGHSQAFLLAAAGFLMATLLALSVQAQQPESITWSYEEFIQAVEQGQVEAVTISPDRSEAIATTTEGDRLLVSLPDDPELVEILTENDVEVAIAPQRGQSPFAQIVSALLIPGLILLTGLAFWVWVLVDCVTKESNVGNTKLVWVLVIVFAQWIGALIYFFVRRPQRLKELGQ